MVDAPPTDPELTLTGKVILSIETSSRGGSIALRGADGIVSVLDLDEGASHGSDLMPAVDRLMRKAGPLAPQSIDWVAVGTGPGSYTGLRVAAATALGLARGADAECVGVPSLAAMALGGLEPGERGATVRNAFGGQLYLASYERPRDPSEPLVEISAPCACTHAEAQALMDPCSVWLIDAKTLEVLGSPPPDGRELRPSTVKAKDVLSLALHQIAVGFGIGPDAVKPLYLRPFEAKNRRR